MAELTRESIILIQALEAINKALSLIAIGKEEKVHYYLGQLDALIASLKEPR